MPSGQVAQIPIGEDQQKNEGENSEPNREFCATAIKSSHFIDSVSLRSGSNYPWFVSGNKIRRRVKLIRVGQNSDRRFHPHFSAFSISATSRSRSMMPKRE